MPKHYHDLAFGLEIETPWATMLARVDPEAASIFGRARRFYDLDTREQVRVQAGFDVLDATYQERLHEVFEGDKIRRGKDSFAEFALNPTFTPDEQIATVQGLYDVGILERGETYPLQVTVGNLCQGRSAGLVLLAAEISDGTTPARISEINTWSRRGIAGVYARKPSELQLDMTVGVELRSLSLGGMEHLGTCLAVIAAASRSVVGSSHGDSRAKSVKSDLDALLTARCRDHGLDTGEQWWNPQGNPQPWTNYATALAEEDWRSTLKADILDVLR